MGRSSFPSTGRKSRNRRSEVAFQPSSLLEWLTPVERPAPILRRVGFNTRRELLRSAPVEQPSLTIRRTPPGTRWSFLRGRPVAVRAARLERKPGQINDQKVWTHQPASLCGNEGLASCRFAAGKYWRQWRDDCYLEDNSFPHLAHQLPFLSRRWGQAINNRYP